MCGPLCEAVLDVAGSAATLEGLARSNLLLVPLDRHGQWYRYHHLFRDMLAADLQRREPGLMPVLRRRAAGWCQRNGLPEEALEYAIAAEDIDAVAGLVANLGVPAYRQGRIALPYLAVQARIELARVHLALADPEGARTLMREIDEVLRRRPGLGTLTGEARALPDQLSAEHASNTPGASALTAAPACGARGQGHARRRVENHHSLARLDLQLLGVVHMVQRASGRTGRHPAGPQHTQITCSRAASRPSQTISPTTHIGSSLAAHGRQ